MGGARRTQRSGDGRRKRHRQGDRQLRSSSAARGRYARRHRRRGRERTCDELGPLAHGLEVRRDRSTRRRQAYRIDPGLLPANRHPDQQRGPRCRRPHPFARGPADDWTNIVDVNLTGMMRVTRAVVPEMLERNFGDIVNMSSISALRACARNGGLYREQGRRARLQRRAARRSCRDRHSRHRDFSGSDADQYFLEATSWRPGARKSLFRSGANGARPAKTLRAWRCSRSSNRRICRSPNYSSCRSTGGKTATDDHGPFTRARRLSPTTWEMTYLACDN